MSTNVSKTKLRPRRNIFLEDDEGDDQVSSLGESGLGGNLNLSSQEIASTGAPQDNDRPFLAQSVNLDSNTQRSPLSHQPDTALHQSPTVARLERPEFIRLRLRESARYQRETEVRVSRTELLGGMMESFATTLGKSRDQLRFIMYDGTRIDIGNTADELEMEDGEVIDVMEEQLGGVYQLTLMFSMNIAAGSD